VYKRNATSLSEVLRKNFPDLEIEINPNPPRRNSFECTVVTDGKEISVWSGIKLGPPRKLKFPDADVVVQAMKKALESI